MTDEEKETDRGASGGMKRDHNDDARSILDPGRRLGWKVDITARSLPTVAVPLHGWRVRESLLPVGGIIGTSIGEVLGTQVARLK
jgi:hypothetical protein